MKKIFKSAMFLAAVATVFTACNKEIDTQESTKKDGMMNIRFSAVVNDAETKATLTTEDDKTFTAAWENGDVMAVEALSLDADYDETGVATWNGSFFDTNLPANETLGEWTYDGFYPAKTDIPFGSARVQSGSNYASAYDVMKGDVTYQNALLGKDPDGGNMVIPMTRLTSIVYFHLTSSLDEALASATLTVEGGDIAAETVSINNGAVEAGSGESNSITITFADGTAPNAQDFRLWFNILPVQATSLTLTMTTASGKTATLSNTKGKSYVAGKLNKIVKSGLTWEEGAKVYTKVTTEPADWSGTYLIVFEGATVNSVEVPPVAFDGSIDDLTVANNGTSVTISDNTITGNSTIDAAVFEIAAVTGGYSIQAVSNTNYIGNESDSNSIMASADALVNTISINEDKSVNIISNGGAYLRYNANSDQRRFRYYKSSSYTNQKPVYLYLLEGSGVIDTRHDVTLSFSPANPNAITLGDSFTAPTLIVDPVAAAPSVTYAVSSEPANCASIDATTGELTISAAGEITVTASIPQNDPDFKPASASYTLTVNSPAGHGISASDPFSVAEVITFVNGLSTTPTTDEYYVTGIISSIANNGTYGASGTYGNATFYISDDGTTTTQFEAFRVLYLGNVKWTSGNPDIAVGDEVVICGRLTKYNDQVETYAATGDNAYNGYLYSLDKAPYFTANVTSSSIEYTGGNTITLNIGANVNWTASINNGASLKIGDANAAATVTGNSDTVVTVVIPENTLGQTYTITFSTTSEQVTAPANIQIIQTKQETLLDIKFVAGTDITNDNFGTLTYKRPITIEFTKGGSNFGYYSPIRFYTSNTLTISSPFDNVVIKKVIFTVTQAGTMTASQGTYSNGTWIGETSELVLTGGTQTRFSDFTVYYSLDGDLPMLSSITVDPEPTKTDYIIGDSFDFSGAVVTASYSDNSTFDVTNLVTTDGATVVATAGTSKTVTVSYTEDGITKTDTFIVNVEESGDEDRLVYTLNGAITGGTNTYAEESDITQEGVSWKVMGNTTVSPWRIGGKGEAERTVYCTTPLDYNISKIEITHGTNSLTVNSMTVIVASDAAFNTVVSTFTPTFVADGIVTIERPSGVNWSQCYYKIIYDVTASTSSNQYFQFKKAEFTGQ